MVFRILQITDTHLTPTTHLRGVPVYEQLNRVLHCAEVDSSAVDLVVFSGDIADEGSEEAYRWLRDKTEAYQDKCIFMPGNHDSIDKMKACMNLRYVVDVEEHKLSHLYEKDSFSVLCLDTANNTLSEKQLNWLIDYKSKLEKEKQLVVFTHHPVLYMGARFMDEKYPLGNISEVHNALAQLKGLTFNFFSGHYHTEASSFKDNVSVHTTPSTMLQIAKGSASFSIETTVPGYRVIEVREDCITSFVKWVQV